MRNSITFAAICGFALLAGAVRGQTPAPAQPDAAPTAPSPSQELEQRTQDLMSHGEFGKAQRLLEGGLALDPNDMPLIAGLADVYVRTKRFEAAYDLLKRFLQVRDVFETALFMDEQMNQRFGMPERWNRTAPVLLRLIMATALTHRPVTRPMHAYCEFYLRKFFQQTVQYSDGPVVRIGRLPDRFVVVAIMAVVAEHAAHGETARAKVYGDILGVLAPREPLVVLERGALDLIKEGQ